MTKPAHHPDQTHIDAVLEPIAPSSGYDFVEIESEPIRIGSPFTCLLGFITKTISLVLQGIRTQWKIACVLALVLVGCELSLRVFEPRLTGRIYSKTITGGYPINFNAQGFRGQPVLITKPEHTKRIVAIGDSVTFGTGAAAEHTWPAQLEQIMNTQDQPVEVINAGLPALDLGHIEQQLKDKWLAYQPDRIVVVLSGNMVSFGYARRDRDSVELPRAAKLPHIAKAPPKSPKDKLVDLYNSFALVGAATIGVDHLKFFVGLENHAYNPAFPTGVMLAHGYLHNEADPAIIEEAWTIFANQLESLVLTANEQGVPITIVYSPPRFMLSDKLTDNTKWVDKHRLTIDPIERTMQICRRLGVDFVDPRQTILAADKPVYMLSDYTHYDQSGHHALAEAIAKSIRSE